MLLNASFNNISSISWRSVLLVEETRVPGENNRSVASHGPTLSHNVVHLALTPTRFVSKLLTFSCAKKNGVLNKRVICSLMACDNGSDVNY